MKIRKKITELSAQDLDEYSIWEYAPEKDEDGQCDLMLLKPRPDISIADPLERMLLIRTEFISVKGKRYSGFCTPYRENDIGYIQPHIIHNGSLIPFWFGIYSPSPDEIKKYYDILGETSESMFPLTYKALVEVVDIKIEGKIMGFLHCPDKCKEATVLL